ncbi:MAG: hypothetical protein KTR28_04795 [Micavibrio sp.]|nr:hypothetical protein [Micavibrio sp.]
MSLANASSSFNQLQDSSNEENSGKELAHEMPKVGLHDHLEGSFEPELIFEIAKRNQMPVVIKRPAPEDAKQAESIDKLLKTARGHGLMTHVDDEGLQITLETPDQLKSSMILMIFRNFWISIMRECTF